MRFHRNLKRAYIKLIVLGLLVGFQSFVGSTSALANDYVTPWKQKHRAIVIDAYEKNEIDWLTLSKNKRVRAFINKASDGLPSPWRCRAKGLKLELCKKTFQNFFMKKQIYHTRRLLAKALGMKWGAYHLGRPGNPIDQANNFIDFADPQEDELIALDIEDIDPKKWISFKDAEIFAKHIHHRLGRYPVLYTNHSTAKAIALRSDEFPILSRMQLWYARFKDRIPGVFPMGNWDNYAMWQFSAGTNCNKRKCLMRVAGTPDNIDVNITTMNIEEFDKAWPFNGLVPAKDIMMVDYQHPKDKTYELDYMVVASITKAEVIHPIHREYHVAKAVLSTEVIHPIHQVYKRSKPVEIAEVRHQVLQQYPFLREVKKAEVTHPIHREYHVAKAVLSTEVIHPIHQVYKRSKVIEIADVRHQVLQQYPFLREVEKVEVTHPIHQVYKASKVIEVTEVTHPVLQQYPFLREVDTAEVTHPIHQEFHAALGIDETIITASIIPPRSVRHPLYR